MEYCLAYITCPNQETALSLAHQAIEAKIAACANILPGMVSVYRWQGEIVESGETLLILKTRITLKERVNQLILENHPYDVPCVIFIPIGKGGNSDYFNWLFQETRA